MGSSPMSRKHKFKYNKIKKINFIPKEKGINYLKVKIIHSKHNLKDSTQVYIQRDLPTVSWKKNGKNPWKRCLST
jgi:hypothetical protein